MLITHHSLPTGHVALLDALRAGIHLPGAAMPLLMKRILAMVHHGTRLAEIYWRLVMVG